MSSNSLSLQPMDQGIINNLKCLYRKEIVSMTLAYLEENVFFLVFFFFFFIIVYCSQCQFQDFHSDAANFVTKIGGQ